MTIPRRPIIRWGRTSHEQVMMVALILVVCIASIRLFHPDQSTPDTRTLWDRVFTSLLSLLHCFGLVIGVSLVLASVEVIKQTALRYQARRIANKLARLEPILRDGHAHATPTSLARVLKLLRDSNGAVRLEALKAAYTLLRAQPELSSEPQARLLFEAAMLYGQGFARTLADAPVGSDLLSRVTLGAKLGAGTSDKRLAPVTSDAVELARWVESHRREESNPEIQVSVGYDTGSLPYLCERARFLALYTFISTTDLKRFQALLRRPPRDPNAAYGLIIRGDVVEVKYPGQGRGHRLDYVFPLPVRLSEANLAGLFREMQLLNLGLLVACAQDSCRVLLRGSTPEWLDATRQAVGRVYANFERRLVATLRSHDRYRNPGQIHRLVPTDHAERVRGLELYRLEECLYPRFSWIVPLYDPDTRWERLLPPLRAVEAMLLHQGEVPDKDVTRGTEFIQQVRRLGYETARSIEQLLAGELPPTRIAPVPPDPFIDASREEATIWYLSRVSQCIAGGEACMEDLADPITFRQAAAYYEIDRAEVAAQVGDKTPEVD